MGSVLWRHAKRAILGTSFLLSVGTLLLAGRSCVTMDSVDRYRQDVAGRDTFHDTRGFFSAKGSIGGGYLRLDLPPRIDWPTDRGWRRNTGSATAVTWPHRWSFLGFGYWNHTMPAMGGLRGRMHVVGIKVPHWFIAGVFGAAPAVAARHAWLRRRTRKRLRAGLCINCAYDVRASEDRCPECGTLIPSTGNSGRG